MLARVLTNSNLAVGSDVWRKPLIHVARLRIERELKINRECVVGVAEKRVADGFASQDAATQVAPHLTEWRIAPYEADLASSPLGVAQQDEIHARDGHRFFDETVEIGRKKAHGSILPLTRVVTLRVRYADETAILVFEGTDMRISARADYAVRATVALARTSGDELVQAERIAEEQGIPAKFLEDP